MKVAQYKKFLLKKSFQKEFICFEIYYLQRIVSEKSNGFPSNAFIQVKLT